MKQPRIGFFGSPDIAVWVLEELAARGMTPACFITNPDAPQGRKMELAPTPVARWGEEHGVTVHKPEALDTTFQETLRAEACDLFVVVAYGKKTPKEIFDMPEHKTLNMHPSLLPLLRGASPIRSAILEDMNPTGVSIMLLAEEMDAGPILTQELLDIPEDEWPMLGRKLDETLARMGGELLADVIPEWIAGNIEPQEQDHDGATFCKKITKAMGELHLNDDGYQNYLKYCAFDGWPGTFFFAERDGKQVRVKITEATFANSKFVIEKIIPEGKKEMLYSEFVK